MFLEFHFHNHLGYHPDHQGSPMGSPGEDYQQRLKPDIELAR